MVILMPVLNFLPVGTNGTARKSWKVPSPTSKKYKYPNYKLWTRSSMAIHYKSRISSSSIFKSRISKKPVSGCTSSRIFQFLYFFFLAEIYDREKLKIKFHYLFPLFLYLVPGMNRVFNSVLKLLSILGLLSCLLWAPFHGEGTMGGPLP